MHDFRIRRGTSIALGAIIGSAGTTLLSLDAHAQTPLPVSATVAMACTLEVPTPLAFGTYIFQQPTPKDGQALITYNCGSGMNISIHISAGLFAENSQRNMVAGSDVLRYAIFKDSDRSQSWGINGTDPVVIASTPGGPQDVIVYGRVAADQMSPPATYEDTLQVSLVVN